MEADISDDETDAVNRHGKIFGLGDLLRGAVQPNIRAFLASRDPLIWGVALLIGGSAAYAAILFRLLIGWVQFLWLGTSSESVFATAQALPWYFSLAAPVAGGLVVGLVLQFAMPGKRAQGVADVIEAQALRQPHLSFREGGVSAFVAALSLGFGASAGREGPVVHLGASIAAFLQRRLKLAREARRILLASGVAAAVSASFNVPLAGVLFAHEVVLGHYALRAFVPIAISSVVGAVVVRAHLGDFPAFIIPQYALSSSWELPLFAVLGLLSAAASILFQFLLMASDDAARRVDIPIWTRPVIGGLLVGAIALAYPQVLGVGYDATDAALKQQFAGEMLLQLFFAKLVATAITLASRFGGGVFSPSLYLGSMIGGIFGLFVFHLFPAASSSYGLYVIAGMGAVAAGILGAPISTTLIAFELTGDYNVTIALLVAVSIATSIHRAFLGRSFFHWQLATRGVFLSEGPHKRILRTLLVQDFMRQASAGEGEGAEKSAVLHSSRLLPLDSLERALREFDRSGQERIAVTETVGSGVVLGWVTKQDALTCFNRALIEAHVDQNR